jgi:hypothetical protein
MIALLSYLDVPVRIYHLHSGKADEKPVSTVYPPGSENKPIFINLLHRNNTYHILYDGSR